MSYTPSISDVRDDGLRRFIANILTIMSLGVALTGAIAWWISHSPGMMQSLFHLVEVVKDGETKQSFQASNMWWFAVALEFAIVLALTWGGLLKRLSIGALLITFTVYAGLNGITLSPVLYAYTDASVTKVFLITAGTFGTCALVGHTTKVNLLPLGSFFLVGLIGLIVAMVVNIFMQSPAMDFAVSAVAVLLFAGLTAYDMQAMREMYYESKQDDVPKLVVLGALTLYLDFINMLLHMLRLFGIKKD
jgi:uncharacterized protein